MTCPRCGCDLVRGMTAARKVCFECPQCGGRLVTLPVLRGSGVGVAVLTQAAREAERIGCDCPGCGGQMSLLRADAAAGAKVEIDVCGSCLSVWCDRGEFDSLVPRPALRVGAPPSAVPDAEPPAEGRLGGRAPRSAERDAARFDEMLDAVARIAAGAPASSWCARTALPILSALVALALVVAHAAVFYDSGGGSDCEWLSMSHRSMRHDPFSLFSTHSAFWGLTSRMAESAGFDPSDLSSALTYPFVQYSGEFAVVCAIVAFCWCAEIERRFGTLRLAGALLALWLASVAGQVAFASVGWAADRLCGAFPVLVGLLPLAWRADDVEDGGGSSPFLGIGIVAGLLLAFMNLKCWLLRSDTSLGFGAALAAFAVGMVMARHCARRSQRGLLE